MLNGDSNGFLTGGQPVDVEIGDFRQAMSIWSGIKSDTSAIRSLLSKGGRVINSTSAAPQRLRDAQGRFTSVPPADRASRGGAAPSVQQTRAVAAAVAQATVRAAVPSRRQDQRGMTDFGGRKRDGGGRFTKDGSEERSAGMLARLAGKLGFGGGGAERVLQDNEDLDPSIKASKEVVETLAPIGGVLKSLTGLMLKPFGFARDKTNKLLEKILKRLSGGSGGSGGGLFGGLVDSIKGRLMMGAGALGGAASGLLPKLAKAIPFLAKASGPLAAIWSSVKSFGTGTDAYAKRMGVNDDGGLLKSVGIRTMGVLSDLGNTLTFGLAEKFGEYIAPAVGRMVDSMVERWDFTMNWWKDAWKSTVSRAQETFASVADWLHEKKDQATQIVTSAAQTAKDRTIGAYNRVDASSGGAVRKAVNFFRGESKGLGVGRFSAAEQSAIEISRQRGEKFRGGSGISDEHRAMAEDAAKRYGLDPKFMLGMMQMESGGNPMAVSATGASGLYQFTAGTAKQYGVTNRFDAKQNIEAAAQMARDNAAALRKRGIAATPENLYLAHQQGAGGAAQIIKGATMGGNLSESSTVGRNMMLNYGTTNTGDYLGMNARKWAQATAAIPARGRPSAVPAEPPTRLNSDKPTPVVAVVKGDTGKNVNDGSIALIATGGMAPYR